MAQYPPPPQPNQHHYNAMYPTAGGAQQLLNPQESFQYNEMNQAMYPKGESMTNAQISSANQAQRLAQHLQQHGSFEEQQLNQSVPQPVAQPQQAGSSHSAETSSQQGHADKSRKANRLRKACDSCSLRKVKCDESGPPCRACTALGLKCTFDRPRRRRGPPNRHAEAIKRAQLEGRTDFYPFSSRQSSPSSPTHAAQALAELSSHASNQQLSADSIGHFTILDALIDDFFTYMHPLFPFPHEPSFREAWKRREDTTNPAFLALLASIVGALVSSFPQKARLRLAARRKNSNFPDDQDIVSRSQKVCSMARGSGYLNSDNLSVYDAATSYFLGLTGLYTHKWRQARLYLGECLTIIRVLGLHKEEDQSFTTLGALPASLGAPGVEHEGNRGQQVDNITLEMGRRIFWTMFTTIRSTQQLGADFAELIIPPTTPRQPYPPLPAEIDDFCIFPTHNEQQPAAYLPLITGFNANVTVFRSYDELTTVDMAWGRDSVVERQRQLRLVDAALKRCNECLKTLPSELVANAIANQHDTSQPQRANGENVTFSQPQFPRDPASSLLMDSDPETNEHAPQQRRQTQHTVQRSNIYASILSTRLYLLRKLWNLSGLDIVKDGIMAAGLDGLAPHTSNADYEQIMRKESADVTRDILRTLGGIDEVNMEPNADNFTAKLRCLGGLLLSLPPQLKSPLGSRAQEPLAAFLQDLSRMETVSIEEDNDTLWTELLAHRAKLAELAASL